MNPMNNEFEFYASEKTLNNRRIELYNEINKKIDLFEVCLEEVKLTQGFPFLDLNRSLIGRYIKFPKLFPVDSTEEQLMRNSVRNQLKNV